MGYTLAYVSLTTLGDEFADLNLVDADTMKSGILFVPPNALAKNVSCLGQSKLCRNGIFCLTSTVLHWTAPLDPTFEYLFMKTNELVN